jgi:hypothetical protein
MEDVKDLPTIGSRCHGYINIIDILENINKQICDLGIRNIELRNNIIDYDMLPIHLYATNVAMKAYDDAKIAAINAFVPHNRLCSAEYELS